MKPDTEESLDELVTWYEERFTPQMVNGSNIKPERMRQNLAVLQDAVHSYRTWKGHPNGIDTILLPPEKNPPAMYESSGSLEPWQEPGAIERAGEINIDARHAVIHQPPEAKTRRAMCGNCGVRYEITDDPVENHHRAMRHKITCGKGDVDQYSEPQRQELLSDFHNQPMQVEFRRREAAAIAAGVPPEVLKITGVSVFGPTPQPAPAREIAAPELYPGTVGELAAAMTKPPAKWWQFWRWFE